MLLEKASKFSIDEIHKKFENYMLIESHHKYSSQVKEYLDQKQKEFKQLEANVNQFHDETVQK